MLLYAVVVIKVNDLPHVLKNLELNTHTSKHKLSQRDPN